RTMCASRTATVVSRFAILRLSKSPVIQVSNCFISFEKRGGAASEVVGAAVSRVAVRIDANRSLKGFIVGCLVYEGIKVQLSIEKYTRAV
ncbi:MAG: hypothetical protein RLZZ335_99, partial [Bacteroidota bacterium]